MVAALLVVARTPPDLAKASPLVEPPRRFVVLVDFKEHRVGAQPGQPPQMQVQQGASESASAAGGGQRDRKDFSCAPREPRQDETMKRTADRCAMRDDVAFAEH